MAEGTTNEQVQCKDLLRIMNEIAERQTEEVERRTKAEKRIVELTEGLKETMVLFEEREESFDSLARINKEQERKVRCACWKVVVG